jgi:hypothetical protein
MGVMLAGAGSASASGGLKHCKSRPDRLAWHIEAKNVKCSVARAVPSSKVTGKVKKAGKHLFSYTTTSGWNCVYTVFHSLDAQDNEGEIADCRMSGAIVRWSDSPGIQPHSLR